MGAPDLADRCRIIPALRACRHGWRCASKRRVETGAHHTLELGELDPERGPLVGLPKAADDSRDPPVPLHIFIGVRKPEREDHELADFGEICSLEEDSVAAHVIGVLSEESEITLRNDLAIEHDSAADGGAFLDVREMEHRGVLQSHAIIHCAGM